MIDPVASGEPEGILLPHDGSGEPERLAQHVARSGPLPGRSPATIAVIEASGLRGRGGAAFPAGVKWQAESHPRRAHAARAARARQLPEAGAVARDHRIVSLVRVPTILLGLSLLATACGTPPSAARSSPSPSPSATPAPPSPSPTPSPTPVPAHVFVIVMENRSYQQAVAQPYVSSLIARYGLATNYHAVAHPSLPNYLALTSGSTWGIHDDGFHRLPLSGLGSELSDAGIAWRAYTEGFTGDCFASPYPYALKHNPFAYYGGRCPPAVVPLTQLAGDLAGATPQLAWITPGLCHDGHDCASSVADQWLAAVVPQITGSPAWQQNGTLYITWDESNGFGANQVALIVVAPNLLSHTAGAYFDHYSLVATIADQLGVARPGQSGGASSIAQAFGIGA